MNDEIQCAKCGKITSKYDEDYLNNEEAKKDGIVAKYCKNCYDHKQIEDNKSAIRQWILTHVKSIQKAWLTFNIEINADLKIKTNEIDHWEGIDDELFQCSCGGKYINEDDLIQHVLYYHVLP